MASLGNGVAEGEVESSGKMISERKKQTRISEFRDHKTMPPLAGINQSQGLCGHACGVVCVGKSTSGDSDTSGDSEAKAIYISRIEDLESDIMIKVGNSYQIHTHQHSLTVASTVFRNLILFCKDFDGVLEVPQKETICLVEVSGDAWVRFLKCLHGSVGVSKGLKFEPSSVLPVAALAFKYDAKGVLDTCEAYMGQVHLKSLSMKMVAAFSQMGMESVCERYFRTSYWISDQHFEAFLPKLTHKTLLTAAREFSKAKRKVQSGQLSLNLVDCKDTHGIWLKAEVIKRRRDSILVHYTGWENKWNEWIPKGSNRIAPIGMHTGIS